MCTDYPGNLASTDHRVCRCARISEGITGRPPSQMSRRGGPIYPFQVHAHVHSLGRYEALCSEAPDFKMELILV